MKRLFSSIFSLLIVAATLAQNPVQNGLAVIKRKTLESQLTFLSSDVLAGREACSEGAKIAGEYLASLYQQYGLSPAGANKTFYQPVPLNIAHKPHSATISIKNNDEKVLFNFPEDFRSERVVKSFNRNCEVIWAGYGLNDGSISEMDLTSYENKIVIRLKGLPETKYNSRLNKWYKEHDEREWNKIKAQTLKESNAFAVFEFDLNDPHLNKYKNQNKDSEKPHKRSSGIYKKSYYPNPYSRTEPYYYLISKDIIDQLIPEFDEQLKNYLNSLQKGKVKPIVISSDIQLDVNANNQECSCNNIVAKIEGSTYPNEIIVVGGHYDHLGNYDGHIWNGADDNASGAIGTATIAKAFMATGIQPKRTIIFANWTAEERGLHGSSYFANTFDGIENIKYYHNYDMVGRSADPSKPDSIVSFIYTASWDRSIIKAKSIVEEYNLGLRISPKPWDKPTSGSDNAPFARKDIPIIWFHTEGHPQYHMPDDTVEKIDWNKFEAIVKTSFIMLWDLANE